MSACHYASDLTINILCSNLLRSIRCSNISEKRILKSFYPKQISCEIDVCFLFQNCLWGYFMDPVLSIYLYLNSIESVRVAKRLWIRTCAVTRTGRHRRQLRGEKMKGYGIKLIKRREIKKDAHGHCSRQCSLNEQGSGTGTGLQLLMTTHVL